MLLHSWLIAVALCLAAGGTTALPPQLSLAALALIGVIALIHSRPRATTTAALFALIVLLAQVPLLGTWPLPGLVALIPFVALGHRLPAWVGTGWLRRGRLDPVTVGLVLGLALVAGAALLAWTLLANPDLEPIRKTYLTDAPWWATLLAGFGFSLVNAAVEEALFRGVLFDTLGGLLGHPPAALVGQAIAFGLLHLHGFPSGGTGVALAAVYGLATGLLRQRSGGLLAPFLAHVLTDMVIVAILLGVA